VASGFKLKTNTIAEMVLFHEAFVALKARCPRTINVNPDDYRLAGEKRLFQGYPLTPLLCISIRWTKHLADISWTRQIVDDGFGHSLAVYQDEKCHVLRIHAAVWSGELKRCPVWTAFGVSVSLIQPHSLTPIPALLCKL
jgi:hypothetical protein